MANIVRELSRELRQPPHKPGLQLCWSGSADRIMIRTDPLKLKRILRDLLTNALEFTEQVSIALEASAQHGGVIFQVSDTARGIPPEALPTLFEPFTQARGMESRHKGGAGLGLHLVHRLVQILGGSVQVKSEVGKGSTFRVWLPRPPAVKSVGGRLRIRARASFRAGGTCRRGPPRAAVSCNFFAAPHRLLEILRAVGAEAAVAGAFSRRRDHWNGLCKIRRLSRLKIDGRNAMKAFFLLMGSAFVFGACAAKRPPAAELSAAQLSVREAEEADAGEHAPLEMRLAREKLEAAERANVEEDYEEARRLAEQAQVDAQLAAAKAQSQRMQNAARQAQQSIESLREESIRRGSQAR